MDKLKTDCRHFHSDRPCAPHKETGVICSSCTEDYDPIKTRILLVKLNAVGDVLRTTSLLPAIHRQWPDSHVTWVTDPSAVTLFSGNSLVDRVLLYEGHLPIELQTEQFDIVLSPDASATSCAIAHAAKADSIRGFDLDETQGTAVPLSEAAERWMEMGLRDDIKRSNRRTYQELMADVLDIPYDKERPILALTKEDKAAGRSLRENHPPSGGGKIIGINTGAGSRWRYKRWTEEGITSLINKLHQEGHRIFLLGGPEEQERNARLASSVEGAAIDTGCDHGLRSFAGIIDVCDAMVTGDTLALHIGLSLSVSVVALFGPTSLHEIEVFETGQRLAGDVECLCCYLPDCDVQPNCMESLSLDTVAGALDKLLETPAR